MWRYKGLALSKLKRYDEAIAVFEKVLEINETDLGSAELKGLAEMELGNKKGRSRLLRKRLTVILMMPQLGQRKG